MSNQAVWFDIPVLDLERATKFYSAVMGTPLEKMDYPGFSIALFPSSKDSVSGCIFVSEKETPSATGILIYLNANGRLDEAIAAVEPNGGKIVTGKHPIGEHGYRAVLLDSEGNRFALHSL